MKIRLKNKWLKALRSGDYTKIKQIIIYGKPADKKMSTLGVLFDVCDQITWSRKDDRSYGVVDDGDFIFSAFIPPRYLEITGLTRIQINEIAYMNDMGDKNFEETADWLEELLSC